LFEVSSLDGVIGVEGEVDVSIAHDFALTLGEAVAADRDGLMVRVDLTGLTFLDEAGVQALLSVANAMGRRLLMLTNPTPAVERLFEITRIGDHPAIRIVRTGP